MSRLTSILETLGATKTEGILFDQLYHYGPSTATQLSSTLSINRATVYHGLHLLSQKGFLVSEQRNGTKVFFLSEKDAFLTHVAYEEEKLQRAKTDLEEYLARHTPKEGRLENSTELYVGEDGIRIALDKAFKCTSKKWDILAPKYNIFTDSNEDFAEYYLSRRKKYKITSRTLWETPKKEKHGIKESILKERGPRYLPKDIKDFSAITILFDASVLFISSHNELTAIVINSKSIHSALSMQFEALYKKGEIPKTSVGTHP
jgi:sugar-specific transcriptional regulator TrmB